MSCDIAEALINRGFCVSKALEFGGVYHMPWIVYCEMEELSAHMSDVAVKVGMGKYQQNKKQR